MPARSETIDLPRLAALREQQPTAASLWRPERHVAKCSSRRGDLVLWESLAPESPVYLPPFEGHVIVVARGATPRSVTWLPTEGVRTRAVSAGDLTILPAGEPMYVDIEGPHSALVLSLQPRTLYRCLQPGSTAQEGRLRLRPVSGTRDRVIQMLAASMAAAVEAGPTASADYLDATATALATHLLSGYLAQPEPVKGRLGRRDLARVQGAMAECLHERLGLDELAALSGYSVYHFAHLFKAATGVTPMRYLLGLRMERARQLVETTRLPLGEIGPQVGIDSPAHFSRSFRAYWNVAPSSLR